MHKFALMIKQFIMLKKINLRAYPNFRIMEYLCLLIGIIVLYLIISYKNIDDDEKSANVSKSIDAISGTQKFIDDDIFIKDLGLSQNAIKLNEKRREKIRNMMLHAWYGYKNHSWGANELKPIAKTFHKAQIFGGNHMGLTIVDAADTLLIMGLTKEYYQARNYIKNKFNYKKAREQLSVFEVNIRFVGGLLSLYSLTKEKFYLNKAKDVADVLLKVFNTPSGVPMALMVPKDSKVYNHPMFSNSSTLAEIGTFHLEFVYLSEMTGNPKYKKKVQKIRNILRDLEKPDGLYQTFISPVTGNFTHNFVTLGGLGDSFYEYLLKSWLRSGKTEHKNWVMYKEASNAIQKKLVQISVNGLRYLADISNGKYEHRMSHLSCFTAGMFALEAYHETEFLRKYNVMRLAEDLADTCHESYIRTSTKIGPTNFYFTKDYEAVTNKTDYGYTLSPEVVESFFYLWRITNNPKYKEWVWEAIMAIEHYCKIDFGGYSGLKNVYNISAGHDDIQQSYFLAETLKYAYLTFDDELLPLNSWVFNTEAHPLPINNGPIEGVGFLQR